MLTRACGRRRRECAIILTPLAMPPPRGSASLERWAGGGSWKGKRKKAKGKSRTKVKAILPFAFLPSNFENANRHLRLLFDCLQPRSRAGPRARRPAWNGSGPAARRQRRRSDAHPPRPPDGDPGGRAAGPAAEAMAGRRRRAAPAVRRRIDQPPPFGSRLGVARGDCARGGGRVVHRGAGGAADEAVHHLQQRCACAGSSAPRPQPYRRPSEARRRAPRVGRARRHGSGVPAAGETAHRRGASAAPGVAYLALKKAQRDHASELVQRARTTVADLYDRLQAPASASRRRAATELPAQGGPLLLDAAFLVPRSRSAQFRALVGRQSKALASHGYQLVMSGPWPPYTFISD